MIQVKESFGIGKHETTGRNETSGINSTNDKDRSKSAFGEEKQQGQQQQQSESSDNAETLFRKVKLGVSSISPKVSLAFNKLKDAKPIDFVKKGYDIVKDEMKGNPNRRKHLEYDASSAAPSPTIDRSTRTDIVVLPSKQSPLSKKWEALKNKVICLLIHSRNMGYSCFRYPIVLWYYVLLSQMRGHPAFKRFSGYSEPVIEKSQEV